MFGRQERLSKEELKELLKNGGSIQSKLFSLRITRAEGPRSKFAFVASKKECGGSVPRSRAKRRSRAAMRQVALPSPVHCAMFIKKDFQKADFKSIVGALRGALQNF